MSSVFSYLFPCCFRPSHSSENEGETQRLLPPEGPPVYVPPDTAAIDRERIKERLGNIVRSKEGKMVNVTDHLPFNLHHRDLNGASSSSRVRTESPSPHPSVETGDSAATRSLSSYRPRGGRSGIPREPALSVRLIRRDGHRGTASRGRLGRFGEERGVEWTSDDHVENPEAALEAEQDSQTDGVNGVAPEIIPLDDADKDTILALSGQIGKQLKDGWKIEDAGPISRGWGD